MADRVGQQLGNYQLIRLLGEGGFAEVYLGEHIHLGTSAAIKVLHTQLTSEDVDTFRNEARMIARLVHPHIVRVLEFGVEGKTPFLVMDYAPNGTLRQRHPRGVTLPLTTIVSYVRQIADALQFAHDEKLIHRDIKPENMLRGRRDEVVLSDFGIALVAQSSRYQSTQDMAGTIAYMAPEQIQGKPRPASDQYALGVVVYEWLTGDRPFHGSFAEIAVQHTIVPPPPLHEKVPTIWPDLEQVVMTTLAKDYKERFASVQAFARALEQAIQRDVATVVKPLSPVVQQQPAATPSLSAPVVQTPQSTTPSELPPTRSVTPSLPPTQPAAATTSVGAVIRGLLAIIFGLIVLVFLPSITLLAFVLVFAVYAIIDGIFAVIVAIRERGSLGRWGWILFEGILSILVGIVAFVYPGLTALLLLYLVAIWAILTGIIEIITAFALREYVSREWAQGLAGVLSIVFGIILFVFQGAGLLSILWLVGIYAIVFGVLFIIRAFQLRSWA